MISALQKDEVLLKDLESASDPNSEALDIWWLGQSGFLIQSGGVRVLFDPYLSDSLTEKYKDTDKPHVRMTELCVKPEGLTGIDWITVSHVHTDHLDGATLRALAKSNPKARLVLPGPIREEAERRLEGIPLELIELVQGETLKEWGIEFFGVSAAHNEIELDAKGRCHCIGFGVRLNGFTVYHSGDTLWHESLVSELFELGKIDLMFLPINGNVPERRVAGNLNGTEAAALARAVGGRLVVPCHFEMFEFNTVSPAEFSQACERLGQPFQVMRCGERLTLHPRKPALPG